MTDYAHQSAAQQKALDDAVARTNHFYLEHIKALDAEVERVGQVNMDPSFIVNHWKKEKDFLMACEERHLPHDKTLISRRIHELEIDYSGGTVNRRGWYPIGTQLEMAVFLREYLLRQYYYDDAVTWAKRAVEFSTAISGETHIDTIAERSSLGVLYMRCKQFDLAETELMEGE